MLRFLVLALMLLSLAAAPPRPKATVYLFLATDCPIAGRYGPRLARLAAVYARRNIAFVAVFPNARETDDAIQAWLADRRLTIPWRREEEELVRRFGVTATPEAVLVDGAGRRLYRGRIDDSDDPARVRSRDLAAALDAVLAGRPVARPVTSAFGCTLVSVVTARPGTPDWSREVAPILDRNCVECHRAGEVGPMPLDRYETAAAFAAKIRALTASRRMPPWHADSHGEFHDERRLTEDEIATLARWAATGASGTPPDARSSLRPLSAFPRSASREGVGGVSPSRADEGGNTREGARRLRNEGALGGVPRTWRLGEPDAVFAMPPFATPAEGKDFYRCFVLPAGNDSDRWVKGIELHPGARAIVHHASVFIDLSGAGRKLDAADPGPGYTNPTPGNGPGFSTYFAVLGGWAPGHTPRLLPEGVGLLLPKGADLVLEVHYHLVGKAESDQTRFGLFFAKEPIKKRLRVGDVGTQSFQIPPGAKGYAVEASRTLTDDVTLYSVTPHMHEYGKRMVLSAELPSGEYKKIVDIPRWDFHWQPSYRFKTPLRLPRGTRVDLKGVFDNPTARALTWGESTKDEMCVCFVAFTLDSERLDEETVVVK